MANPGQYPPFGLVSDIPGDQARGIVNPDVWTMGLLSLSPDMLKQPDIMGPSETTTGRIGRGRAFETGIGVGTGGFSWMRDAGVLGENVVRNAEMGSKPYSSTSPTGPLGWKNTDDLAIDYHTENWTDPTTQWGTTDYIQKGMADRFGLQPFDHSLAESAGRIAAGFGPAAAIPVATKAAAAVLSRAASMAADAGVTGMRRMQGGSVGTIDMPGFEEIWGGRDTRYFLGGKNTNYGTFTKGGKTRYLKNPEPYEIKEAGKHVAQFRVTKDVDGNFYAWDAEDGTHQQFHEGLQNKLNKDIAFDDKFWRDNSKVGYTADLLQDYAVRHNPPASNVKVEEIPALGLDDFLNYGEGFSKPGLEGDIRQFEKALPGLANQPISNTGAIGRQRGATDLVPASPVSDVIITNATSGSGYGGIIRLEFDNAGKIPTNQDISDIIKSIDDSVSVEVQQMGRGPVSDARGTTVLRLSVRAGGRDASSELTNKIISSLVGGGLPPSGPTTKLSAKAKGLVDQPISSADASPEQALRMQQTIYAGTYGAPQQQIAPYGDLFLPGGVGGENRFGGIFGSTDREVALSHGDTLQEFTPANMIDDADFRTSVLYDDGYYAAKNHVRDIYQQHKGQSLSDDEVDELLYYISGDKNVYDSPQRFGEITGIDVNDTDALSEAAWDLQGIKGEVARRMGYDAVGIVDEHGESVLVLSNPLPKKIKPISNVGPFNRQRGAVSLTGPGLVSEQMTQKQMKQLGFGRGATADPAAPAAGLVPSARSRQSVDKVVVNDIIDGPDYTGSQRTVRDVADELEQRTLAAQGGKPLALNEANLPILSDRLAAEGAAELGRKGNAAHWYRDKMDELHDLATEKYPELGTDENAMAAFDWGLAVTSNGQTVDANVDYANRVYDYVRSHGGKFPTSKKWGWGKESGKMREAFTQWNEGVDQFGADMWRRAMDTEFTVRELEQSGLTINGLKKDAKVHGSAIAGPKIGAAFYQNIRGNRTPITKDLWFTRMFNRLRGDMKTPPAALDRGRERYVSARNEMIRRGYLDGDAPDVDYDQLARADYQSWSAAKFPKLAKVRPKSDKRPVGKLNKAQLTDEMNASARTHAANLNPREAPTSGGEREYMDRAINGAIDRLRSQGLVDDDFQGADFQALVWFPEKVLYSKMGAKDTRSAPTDYAIEMGKILDKEKASGNVGTAGGGRRRAQPGGGQRSSAPPGRGLLSPTEKADFTGADIPGAQWQFGGPNPQLRNVRPSPGLMSP